MVTVLVQTQSLLLQPKVWRFVGFGSSLVGLFCYAFSSSFNHLFGHWTFLKIFLYGIFSLITSFTILFANMWQYKRNHRFKAHSAFLVLTITTVYSFFSDKVLNNYGKPDAYSLISCAAFAIMSVSLSRQIQFGFEVDLLYFFLGCLMMQLMKIKLQLVIVGAVFSYSLIMLRSSFSSIDVASPENEYPGLQDEHVIIQVDSSQLNSNKCSITHRLLNCMKELQKNNSNLTNMLLLRVKEYLQGNSELVVTDHNFIIDALPPEMINDLQETAKMMADAGFEKEFSEAYTNWLRKFLEECVINKVLGLGKMGFQDYMIGRWMKASKVALRIVFPGGRQLCDRVFSGFSSKDSDLCFSEVCRGATIQLLNFVDAFASRSPSAWQLFQILEIFQTLDGLIPEFQSLFTNSLVNEAMRARKRLGEASRDIFMELGNLIFDIPEAVLDAWPDGGVHLMTTTGVTAHLIPAFWSRKILEQILGDFPKDADGVGKSSFSLQMEWIMEQFERKLEDKSKIYKDPALRYFFMMNNMRYIDSQLGTILGDDRFQKKTLQKFELYCRSSWSKLFELLKLDLNESHDHDVIVESMKEKLNLFYLQFREICGVQSTWRVCDKQLRKQIIESVENMLLPAYGNFIARFKDVLGRQSDEFIEYEISDLQDMLNSTICFLGSC